MNTFEKAMRHTDPVLVVLLLDVLACDLSLNKLAEYSKAIHPTSLYSALKPKSTMSTDTLRTLCRFREMTRGEAWTQAEAIWREMQARAPKWQVEKLAAEDGIAGRRARLLQAKSE